MGQIHFASETLIFVPKRLTADPPHIWLLVVWVFPKICTCMEYERHVPQK